MYAQLASFCNQYELWDKTTTNTATIPIKLIAWIMPQAKLANIVWLQPFETNKNHFLGSGSSDQKILLNNYHYIGK